MDSKKSPRLRNDMVHPLAEDTDPPQDRRVEDERLERIESKVDKLSESMLCLVRMEERMMWQNKTIERLENEVNELKKQRERTSHALGEIEASEHRSNDKTIIYERIFWIFITAVLGYIGFTGGPT